MVEAPSQECLRRRHRSMLMAPSMSRLLRHHHLNSVRHSHLAVVVLLRERLTRKHLRMLLAWTSGLICRHRISRVVQVPPVVVVFSETCLIRLHLGHRRLLLQAHPLRTSDSLRVFFNKQRRFNPLLRKPRQLSGRLGTMDSRSRGLVLALLTSLLDTQPLHHRLV
jgi:hypothetical protein